MSFDTKTLEHFADSSAAAAYVVEQVSTACKQAVEQRGVFHWVLAGGSTPEASYRLLRDADLPWQAVHVWFGDERALKKGHPDRNETMARDALLDHVVIPKDNIHTIDFPASTADAASDYAQAMSVVPSFDLVLLGMGEDGHTASLFPNNAALGGKTLAVPVYESPKPPSERVSMSLNALNNSHQTIILATGASKSEVLKSIVQGDDLPVTHITDATWVVDQAAWPT